MRCPSDVRAVMAVLLVAVTTPGVGRGQDSAFDSGDFQEARLRQSWTRLERERELREVDKIALAHVAEFEAAAQTAEPVRGDNGRVIFYFGAQVPKVACRPLTVCDIELEAGERVMDWFGGDLQRWRVAESQSGAGADARMHLLVKPMASGATETNLVVHTDRRTYHIDLVSPAAEPMRFVSFNYPKSPRALFDEAEEAAGAGRTGDGDRGDSEYSIAAEPWNVHRNYAVEKQGRRRVRRRIDWAPAPHDVFDDGEKTFIQLPESVLSRERPILFVENASGKHAIVEYRSKGAWLIVDRLFDTAYLVLGSGRSQERVAIVRRP